MNESIMKKCGFGQQVALMERGLCVFCKKPIVITEFKDLISLREYEITGVCQTCQDYNDQYGDE